MDSKDVIDNVNALLKLGVGDPYRLEHIKQAYILNNIIWKSDNKYLEQLREKYLVKHRIDQPDTESEIVEKTESESEDKDMIHCWKCGKKSPTRANFCMVCGASIFEVGAEPKTADVQMPSNSKNQRKSIGLKIPILIGIPVLILIIIGGAYSQGLLDNTFEKYSSDDSIEDVVDSKVSNKEATSPSETHSKCGPGTVLKDGECVAESEASTEKVVSSTETHSKCGPGTVLKDGECVAGK